MKKYKVGIVGATGVVGQRFVSLIHDHPWFELASVAASSRSAGKSFGEAVSGRWSLAGAIPDSAVGLEVLSAENDIAAIAGAVDFVFSAVDMNKDEIKVLEEAYAKAECPVISNNSAHRWTLDVPMIIPEVNPEHLDVISAQRMRLGTKRGFIAVKSNCSIQSYVPALHPIREKYGLSRALVCTYQAISGAGKTFESWPEMVDNVIPYISGEDLKSELEPKKVWGMVRDGVIVPDDSVNITAQCVRVPATDGHMAAVFASFTQTPSIDEILGLWSEYRGRPQVLDLPSAPKQFLHYFEEPDRPQTGLDRLLEGGMAVSLGRLRPDSQFDYKFIGLSHNTLRGAAGGAVLLAELLCAEGFVQCRMQN